MKWGKFMEIKLERKRSNMVWHHRKACRSRDRGRERECRFLTLSKSGWGVNQHTISAHNVVLMMPKNLITLNTRKGVADEMPWKVANEIFQKKIENSLGKRFRPNGKIKWSGFSGKPINCYHYCHLYVTFETISSGFDSRISFMFFNFLSTPLSVDFAEFWCCGWSRRR